MIQNYQFFEFIPFNFFNTISDFNLILVFISTIITLSLPIIYLAGKNKLWEAGKIIAGASALGAIEGSLNELVDTKLGPGSNSNTESKGGTANPDNKPTPSDSTGNTPQK